ncbi:MAG: alpha-xylosidase [Gemmatimonadetes bacterium]|nr:alpha-xylosidase [Gemmatimonadota bacterium]
MVLAPTIATAQYQTPADPVFGDPVDVSQEFRRLDPTYFVASQATSFDPATGTGTLRWDRYQRQTGYSFAKVDLDLARGRANEFPGTEYATDPALPFSISFVTPRTVRLRFSTRPGPLRDTTSLMLAGPPAVDRSWRVERTDSIITWTSAAGRVRLITRPWHIELYDASGKLLTRTMNVGEPKTYSSPTPFSFIRRASDLGRSTAAAFHLAHDEKIFGTGESFTRLNKRGQKLVLFTRDAMGSETPRFYKPIPFYLSSRGYGAFVHTSAPVTFDFGHDFDESAVLYTGDEVLDIFLFLGGPKQVLEEYTALTGRSPVPPLWSFGLWMSRITYKAEAEVREVAQKLRDHRIPTDVLHLDTGWFETDWQSNFEFSTSRFTNPRQMFADLKRQGFNISLWQLPYFTPRNNLYPEIVEKGLAVRNQAGVAAAEDAVLDMSNPEVVRWYQGKLGALLGLGAAAIKVDFGEGAPLTGLYASGRSGWYEHNLYPLRYNQVVFDLTRRVKGQDQGIIWARSAWAGSQRYPLHWGGDAENTDAAMAAQLRSGLSFGLSGFTYWSHDIGGFVAPTPRDLYRRWLPFGMLTSHSRAHGAPPKEPWEYDPAFVDEYRRAVELKYALMPYVYAQAKSSSVHGWPMLRTLFFEFPDDPTSWQIEDEYFLGSDLLVAPLFDSTDRRDVYLPPGSWVDYQTGQRYAGARWHEIAAGPIPIVLMVRDHAVIPHAAIAQSTAAMDWSRIELRVFSSDDAPATGLFSVPDGELQTLRLEAAGQGMALRNDPLRGRVIWRVTRGGAR